MTHNKEFDYLTFGNFEILAKDSDGEIGIANFGEKDETNYYYINQEELKQLIEFLTKQLEK